MFLAYIQDSDPPTNVRSAPSSNSDKIGTLENGTVITVLEKTDNNWLKISKPIAGYISASLARTNTPPFYRDEVGSIAAWQHLLNGCGYHPDNASQLVITGQFDAETVAVTKKFQRDMGLEETGDVSDIRTWQKAFDHDKLPGWPPVIPDQNHVEPPDYNLSEAAKYDYCRQVILSHGGNFYDDVNRRNLLSFRKETKTTENEYDDWTFMFWKDSNEQKHCRRYKSNTEPSSNFEDQYGVDANHDGRKDLGRLPEGYYEYVKGSDNHLGDVLRPTQEARNVIRDIDHDGIFEPNEPTASAGKTMLFHQGRTETMTGSAGCQTMPPSVYPKFWNDLTDNTGVIGYTIVRWRSLSQT
jgi:peptidoglycan hydrolase-like protein with peptidoglycan-binding domain